MAPIRIPPALRWALRHGKEAAASMDTITMCTDTFLCIGYKAYHTEQGDSYIRPLPPKPPETIPFLCNRIDLIGNLTQHVDITYLDSGHTRGTSVIRYLQYDGKSLLFHVEFWDELAEMAAVHTKKGTVVHVSGILHVANILDEGSKTKFQWTVTATKLNLIVSSHTNRKSTQENIQEVDEDLGKPSVIDDDLSINCETAQTIVQAANEHLEKHLIRSTQKIIEAVDADVETTSEQDDCTCNLTQKTIEAVDVPVQDECTREIAEDQDGNFF